jgi:hypothetical protein
LRRALAAGAVVALGVGAALVAARGRQHDDASRFANSCAASGIEVPKPTELPSSFPLPPIDELPGCSTAVVLTLRFGHDAARW